MSGPCHHRPRCARNRASAACHPCAAARKWEADAAAEAERLADHFGAYYGEFWTQVFRKEGLAGVLKR